MSDQHQVPSIPPGHHAPAHDAPQLEDINGFAEALDAAMEVKRIARNWWEDPAYRRALPTLKLAAAVLISRKELTDDEVILWGQLKELHVIKDRS